MDTEQGTIWGREPAMVLALVQAVIALVVAFGLSLAPDQIGAILAAAAIVRSSPLWSDRGCPSDPWASRSIDARLLRAPRVAQANRHPRG